MTMCGIFSQHEAQSDKDESHAGNHYEGDGLAKEQEGEEGYEDGDEAVDKTGGSRRADLAYAQIV